MVTAAILGHRGMLGSVVARRWAELGAEIGTIADAEYVVNCIRPDDLIVSERLCETSRLIQPSTDAIAEPSDYAIGKRLLERLPAVTIRSGIVDVSRLPPIAYRNWTCNPLTPLEWADLAWDLRDRPGVHIAGREIVTRWFIGAIAAAIWDLPSPAPAYADEPLDRAQPDARSWPDLASALAEYRAWLG